MACPVSNLPTEVTTAIAAKLDSKSDLSCLSLTCKKMYLVATPLLYESIEVSEYEIPENEPGQELEIKPDYSQPRSQADIERIQQQARDNGWTTYQGSVRRDGSLDLRPETMPRVVRKAVQSWYYLVHFVNTFHSNKYLASQVHGFKMTTLPNRRSEIPAMLRAGLDALPVRDAELTQKKLSHHIARWTHSSDQASSWLHALAGQRRVDAWMAVLISMLPQLRELSLSLDPEGYGALDPRYSLQPWTIRVLSHRLDGAPSSPFKVLSSVSIEANELSDSSGWTFALEDALLVARNIPKLTNLELRRTRFHRFWPDSPPNDLPNTLMRLVLHEYAGRRDSADLRSLFLRCPHLQTLVFSWKEFSALPEADGFRRSLELLAPCLENLSLMCHRLMGLAIKYDHSNSLKCLVGFRRLRRLHIDAVYISRAWCRPALPWDLGSSSHLFSQYLAELLPTSIEEVTIVSRAADADVSPEEVRRMFSIRDECFPDWRLFVLEMGWSQLQTQLHEFHRVAREGSMHGLSCIFTGPPDETDKDSKVVVCSQGRGTMHDLSPWHM